MEFFTTARIRWDHLLGKDAQISASQWDRLSAEAGIVSGREAWRAQLEAARQEREARGFEDDRTLKLYDGLLKAIDRLASDLDGLPRDRRVGRLPRAHPPTSSTTGSTAAASPASASSASWALSPSTPRRPRARSSWRGSASSSTARSTARAPWPTGASSSPPSPPRGACRSAWSSSPAWWSARFPAPPRPDPLLLDDEREALDPALRTTRDAVEEQRLLFLDATRAAEERLVLSYPRFETATGRERVPSSFLLEAVEAAVGQRVAVAELARLADPGPTGLGRPHPEAPDDAVDLVERDLALVASGNPGAARHLLEDAPTVEPRPGPGGRAH